MSRKERSRLEVFARVRDGEITGQLRVAEAHVVATFNR
jgi:hypothetical protein